MMHLISILVLFSAIARALSSSDQEAEVFQPSNSGIPRLSSEWHFPITTGIYGNPLHASLSRYFALRARVPTTTAKPPRVMSQRSGATWYLGKRSSKYSSYLDKADPRKWQAYFAKRFGSSKAAPWYLG